jgi:hypothetical protein
VSMRGNGRTRSKYAESVWGGRGSSSDDKPANYNPTTLRLHASAIKAGELGNEREANLHAEVRRLYVREEI